MYTRLKQSLFFYGFCACLVLYTTAVSVFEFFYFWITEEFFDSIIAFHVTEFLVFL